MASVAIASAVSACQPLPPELDRFIGIRDPHQANTPVIVFGRCGDELVTRVEVRFSDPPQGVEPDGVLWRITSSGSIRTRFTLGETPPDFTEAVPFARAQLPPWPLEAIVSTTGRISPDTVLPFRGDSVPSAVFHSNDGRPSAREVAGLSEAGCMPETPQYQ